MGLDPIAFLEYVGPHLASYTLTYQIVILCDVTITSQWSQMLFTVTVSPEVQNRRIPMRNTGESLGKGYINRIETSM